MLSDLEISRRLALAIGWNNVSTHNGSCYVYEPSMFVGRAFDYRDEVVAFRVAERFDCFPIKLGKRWCSFIRQYGNTIQGFSDTPQKAIALAVIAERCGNHE